MPAWITFASLTLVFVLYVSVQVLYHGQLQDEGDPEQGERSSKAERGGVDV